MNINQLVTLDSDRIRVTDEIKANIVKEVKKSQAVVLKCDCLGDSETAANRRNVLNALAKALENKRLDFGRKITEFKKGWDSFFNDIKGPAEVEVKRINGLLTGYQAKLREEQAEEERKRQAEIAKREKIQEAHKAQGHQIDETPREALVPEVVPMKTKMAAKMRTLWRYEILNAAEVPREYLCVDTVKIQKSITRKENPMREIPGVRIYSIDIPC